MLIGICGKAGAGKTTIARFLVERYGFQEINFADPLKRGAQQIFGFTDEQLYGDKKEAIDPFWKVTPREVFQVMGTDLFRNRLPEVLPSLSDIWVRSAEKRIETCLKAGISVVVPDLRFPNEVKLFEKHGGIIWRVVRSDDHGICASFKDHESEKHSEGFSSHGEIQNDHDYQRLYCQVMELIIKTVPKPPISN